MPPSREFYFGLRWLLSSTSNTFTITPAQVQSIFDFVDKDGNQSINYLEFKQTFAFDASDFSGRYFDAALRERFIASGSRYSQMADSSSEGG